jgi:hypothetical protein
MVNIGFNYRKLSGENHRPAASHWQTISHNVVSSTPSLSEVHDVHKKKWIKIFLKEFVNPSEIGLFPMNCNSDIFNISYSLQLISISHTFVSF